MKYKELQALFRENKVKNVTLTEVRENYFSVEANAEMLITKRGEVREFRLETAKMHLSKMGCKRFYVKLRGENNE